MTQQPRTLYQKIWDAHVVERRDDGTCLIFIDRHLTHEVTSPQAFESLRLAGRGVRRPDLTIAVPDHNLPTTPRVRATAAVFPSRTPSPRPACCAGEERADFGVPYIDAAAAEQGIVHVVGPEQGFSLPGTTIVCGDSHTASHGASARWRSASARARSSMSSRRRRCCSSSRRRWKCGSRGRSASRSAPRM